VFVADGSGRVCRVNIVVAFCQSARLSPSAHILNTVSETQYEKKMEKKTDLEGLIFSDETIIFFRNVRFAMSAKHSAEG
jgi:hypothetical protein